MTVPGSDGVARRFEMGEGLTLTVFERGDAASDGKVLLLHGGIGAYSVEGLASLMSEHSHVITPVHPGLDGTPRPEWFDSVGDLATAYLDLLDEVDFREVLVVGTSFGGWIATEMALRDNHDRIGGLVLIGSVGIRANDPREIVDPINGTDFVQRVFHDPDDDSFADLPDEQRASAKKNVPALRVYGGKPYMHDPKLRRRLRRVTIPALLIWGECDEITPLEYGLAYARSFPRARFRPIADAGHVPQLKAPDSVAMTIYDFVTEELPHFARG